MNKRVCIININLCHDIKQPSYVISYRGILCHDMSHVTIIAASLYIHVLALERLFNTDE